jgi:alpha-glucoside transport system substrate-binding protein
MKKRKPIGTLFTMCLLFSVLLLTTAPLYARGNGEEEAPEGNLVSVFGAFRDEEAYRFEESMKPFEDRTGIDVQYEFSSEFETLIFVRVEGGNPPDVAALPQPGLMKNFASKGALKPLWPGILDKIGTNYAPVWKDLGAHEGTPYGVFHRVNVKSLVWYPKKAWKDAGYPIPKTWDELAGLMDRMVRDGGVPWTIGIESGGATGWVATDWVEDIMLRTAGPEVYDQWVNHEIPFNDPRVKRACEMMGEIWLNTKYVYGGPTYILTTFFGDAPNPLFEDPPQAWMHRQGNFIAGFFPEGVQANLDEEVAIFGLPAIDPKWGTPVLGGGDQFVVFNDRPEVRSFMEYLTTGESGKAWAQAGGALFPHKDQDLGWYPTEIARVQAKLLLEAEVFRFDASDLMPAEVGAGTFWTGMVDYISGVPLDKVLDTIEKSWPE